jgi:hypothetical protein
MKRTTAVAITTLCLAPGVAHAGYVSSWVTAKGGCRPGVLMLLNADIAFNEYRYLDKLVSEWTDADFEDYRQVYLNCAQQYPRVVSHTVVDPGGVALERNTREHLAMISKFVVQRSNRERQQAIEAEGAKLDMERDAAVRKRQKMIADAQHDREIAERTAKQADEEAPQIAEAERQFAEASRQRAEAEKRLQDIRNRVAAQQQQRNVEEARESVAMAERMALQRTETERSELAALQGHTCEITQQNFERARYGMTLREVQKNFGCTGEMASGINFGGSKTYTTYVFRNPDNMSGAQMTFDRQYLYAKSRLGLP